ncbi:hypothetical protein AAFN86_19095 [Roseomonas sp. CAU 1739]|uniref:hypothetical protein n=1 Tax=Roseomonas sp. CAU 1739 TaxID=3140364 RepID=UPI00325AA9DF
MRTTIRLGIYAVVLGLFCLSYSAFFYPSANILEERNLSNQSTIRKITELELQMSENQKEIRRVRQIIAENEPLGPMATVVAQHRNFLRDLEEQSLVIQRQINEAKDQKWSIELFTYHSGFIVRFLIPFSLALIALGVSGITGCLSADWWNEKCERCAAIAAPISVIAAFLAPKWITRILGIPEQEAIRAEIGQFLIIVSVAALAGLMAMAVMAAAVAARAIGRIVNTRCMGPGTAHERQPDGSKVQETEFPAGGRGRAPAKPSGKTVPPPSAVR